MSTEPENLQDIVAAEEDDDVEGHKMLAVDGPDDEDDVEGHRIVAF